MSDSSLSVLPPTAWDRFWREAKQRSCILALGDDCQASTHVFLGSGTSFHHCQLEDLAEEESGQFVAVAVISCDDLHITLTCGGQSADGSRKHFGFTVLRAPQDDSCEGLLDGILALIGAGKEASDVH
jgi:hypothetical protein